MRWGKQLCNKLASLKNAPWWLLDSKCFSKNYSSVFNSWPSQIAVRPFVILMATRKDAFMKHSKWLHFLPPKEDYIAEWSRINNWLTMNSGLRRGLFQLFNNWYNLGTRETVKRDCTSLWEESCIHSCTMLHDMRGTIIIFSAPVAPISLYLQIKRLSQMS